MGGRAGGAGGAPARLGRGGERQERRPLFSLEQDLPAVAAAEPQDRRGRGAEHLDVRIALRAAPALSAEPLAQGFGLVFDLLGAGSVQPQVDQAAERRIVKGAAKLQLGGEK